MASAVLLPTNAKNNDVPVAVEEIVTFAKLDPIDVRNRMKKSYEIIFYVDTLNRRKITWRYDDMECRDADYNKVVNELQNTES